MEKNKQNDREEQKKKLSPDIVDDEDKKEYQNQSIMEQIFGDEEIDHVIATAVGEDDDKKTDENDEDDEVKTEHADLEDDDKKSEQPEDKGSDKEEEKVVVDLDEKVQKALSKYEGDLNQKLSALVESYNNLLAKMQTYGTVKNVIEELGFQDKKPDEVAAIMKELKTAAIDMMNNPFVLDVLDGLAKGKLPESVEKFVEEKTVSDFMPDGEVFDSYDAMNDPSSPSWKAREEWERWRLQKQQALNDFQQKIQQKKEALNQAVNPELAEKVKKKFQAVEIFAKDEYGADSELINEFKEYIKELPEEFLKVGFAVFAKKKGIQSKFERKLKNQTKFIESDVSSVATEEPGGDDLSEVFVDWDANDDLIV